MATRAEVDRLAVANRSISNLVIRDLNAFWATLDLSFPEAARDALLEFLPVLVRQYGDIAATVSADWYASVRASVGAPGTFRPQLAGNVQEAKVTGTVRRLAEHLFDGQPDLMLDGLLGRITKYALQSGRDTIELSARRDPWKPRVARVPTGSTTCDFCLMLASRGPVYSSREKAGATTTFHPHDDCQIVVIGKNDALPEGYDPDELTVQYQEKKAALAANR